MSRRLVITFGNLYPSALRPQHGTFVQERMQRVTDGQHDLELVVVNPVPIVPRPLALGEYRKLRATPATETVAGVAVHHPRYFHVPGLSVARQATRIATAALPVVRALARGRTAVLDAHYVYPDGVAAASIARELRLPCLVTARGTDVNVLACHPRVAPQVRAASPAVQAWLAVSQALAGRLSAVLGPGSNVQVARNGVDLHRFARGDQAVARARLGLPAAGRLVLGVGRLVSSKGFGLAVDALASLPADVGLVLVGDGPERTRLARRAPPGRLHLLGARGRDDVALAYQACDLFTLPSQREGWPNVVTEALASGLPVVATSVGGIPEIVSEPVAGELVAPDDPLALSAALARRLALPPDRGAVAAFARRYSWDAPIELLRRLLRAATV